MIVESGELDLDVFAARVHTARLAVTRDELTAAASQFHAAALDMWRAEVLIDIEPGPRPWHGSRTAGSQWSINASGSICDSACTTS